MTFTVNGPIPPYGEQGTIKILLLLYGRTPLARQTSIFLDLLLSLRGRFEMEREGHFEPKFPFSSLSNVKLSHTKQTTQLIF